MGNEIQCKEVLIMSINSKSSPFCQLNNRTLQQVEENPHIGITLTDNLKFGTHISKISNKANLTMGFLKRITVKSASSQISPNFFFFYKWKLHFI